MKLAGKLALVTGASSGIGAGVAAAFAAEGAEVALNYPDESCRDEVDAVVARITSNGGKALAVQADVADADAVTRMLTDCEQQLGPLDILVNNAGIASTAPLEELPIEDFDRLLAVHLRGTFLTTRGVLPGMYKRNRGRIINTASQLAYKGAPGFSHYTAAKAAIIGLTRSLALEVGSRQVRVNCVAPGATLTPILADVPPPALQAIEASIPVGHLAQVKDIVPSYVFLASDDASHYQGQVLSPNGGDVFL